MRVFLLRIFDKIAEDRLVIVSNNENLLYRFDLGDGLEAVLNDWMAGYFEEGLCTVSMTMSRYREYSYLTLGTSSDKGLNRVPLLGPPTFIGSQLHSSSNFGESEYHTRTTAFVVGATPLLLREGMFRVAIVLCVDQAKKNKE